MERSRRRIIARLEREGWIAIGGTKHDLFRHPDKPGVPMTLPRHRELSPGVARTIAAAAGWADKEK